jgi:hypothetical protein
VSFSPETIAIMSATVTAMSNPAGKKNLCVISHKQKKSDILQKQKDRIDYGKENKIRDGLLPTGSFIMRSYADCLRGCRRKILSVLR